MITIKKVYRADNGDVFATLENDYIRDTQDWAALVREAEAMEPAPCQAVTITDPIQALCYNEPDGTFIADSAFIAPELKGFTLAHGFYLSRAERPYTASERAAKAVLRQAKLRRMQRKAHFEYDERDHLLIDGMWIDSRFPTAKIVQIDEDFYRLTADATCRDGYGTAKALIPLPDYIKPDCLEPVTMEMAIMAYQVAFRCVPEKLLAVGRAITPEELDELMARYGVNPDEGISSEFQETLHAVYGKQYETTVTCRQLHITGANTITIEGRLKDRGIYAFCGAPHSLNIRVK